MRGVGAPFDNGRPLPITALVGVVEDVALGVVEVVALLVVGVSGGAVEEGRLLSMVDRARGECEKMLRGVTDECRRWGREGVLWSGRGIRGRVL